MHSLLITASFLVPCSRGKSVDLKGLLLAIGIPKGRPGPFHGDGSKHAITGNRHKKIMLSNDPTFYFESTSLRQEPTKLHHFDYMNKHELSILGFQNFIAYGMFHHI